MKKKKLSVILIALIVTVFLTIAYNEIKFWYCVVLRYRLGKGKPEDITYLNALKKDYAGSLQKLILINEKIIEIDSMQKSVLYELGFEYIRLADLMKFKRKENLAHFFRQKGLEAFDKYVITFPPYFSIMQNVADLYYSFGEQEKALELYRDIGQLILTDSIKFIDTTNFVQKKEHANKLVHKETTLIKIEFENRNK